MPRNGLAVLDPVSAEPSRYPEVSVGYCFCAGWASVKAHKAMSMNEHSVWTTLVAKIDINPFFTCAKDLKKKK